MKQHRRITLRPDSYALICSCKNLLNEDWRKHHLALVPEKQKFGKCVASADDYLPNTEENRRRVFSACAVCGGYWPGSDGLGCQRCYGVRCVASCARWGRKLEEILCAGACGVRFHRDCVEGAISGWRCAECLVAAQEIAIPSQIAAPVSQKDGMPEIQPTRLEKLFGDFSSAQKQEAPSPPAVQKKLSFELPPPPPPPDGSVSAMYPDRRKKRSRDLEISQEPVLAPDPPSHKIVWNSLRAEFAMRTSFKFDVGRIGCIVYKAFMGINEVFVVPKISNGSKFFFASQHRDLVYGAGHDIFTSTICGQISTIMMSPQALNNASHVEFFGSNVSVCTMQTQPSDRRPNVPGIIFGLIYRYPTFHTTSLIVIDDGGYPCNVGGLSVHAGSLCEIQSGTSIAWNGKKILYDHVYLDRDHF